MTKKKKTRNSKPGDIIKTRDGMCAVVGEYGSLITHGVFTIKSGPLLPQKRRKPKLKTEEKQVLR